MARPQKSGLDYFALDVYMSDEVELIEAEHGLVGFAIIIKLFQKIYSEGYFYKWDDKEQILFSSRVSSDRNLVTSIVDDCIKWGIFNEKMHEKYKILTSRRIQSHYVTATYKRVNVEVIKEYLLIDVSDRTNLNIIKVSDDGNPPASTITDGEDTPENEEKEDVDEEEYEFDEESEEVRLAVFMISEILRIKPDSKVPKSDIKSLQAWAKQIDYMIRIDKRTPRSIAELFRWTQEDTFWCSNVRSPRKLREQWDRLEIQMKNKKNSKPDDESNRTESINNYGW